MVWAAARHQWGVVKLMKVAGVRSGGLFLFQLRRPNCNQIKWLAKFDSQFAVAREGLKPAGQHDSNRL